MLPEQTIFSSSTTKNIGCSGNIAILLVSKPTILVSIISCGSVKLLEKQKTKSNPPGSFDFQGLKLIHKNRGQGC